LFQQSWYRLGLHAREREQVADVTGVGVTVEDHWDYTFACCMVMTGAALADNSDRRDCRRS